MLAVGEERGVSACLQKPWDRQAGYNCTWSSCEARAALFQGSRALFVSPLGVLPLYRAETLTVLVLFQEFTHGCFSAPKAGIVQKTKPGWSAVVKNKEVLIFQEKNAGNRSCERGNE